MRLTIFDCINRFTSSSYEYTFFCIIFVMSIVFSIFSFFSIKTPFKKREFKALSLFGLCVSVFTLFFIYIITRFVLEETYSGISRAKQNQELYAYIIMFGNININQAESEADFLFFRTIFVLLLYIISIINYWMIFFRDKYFSLKGILKGKSLWVHKTHGRDKDIIISNTKKISSNQIYRKDIVDSTGNLLGYIVNEEHITKLYNSSDQYLGEYNSITNQATDSCHQNIGEGIKALGVLLKQ